MPYLRPAKGKKAGKHSRFSAPPVTASYQGGFTFPGWTGRPHMGPGNWVSKTKSPHKGDEKYRQHDIGYGQISNAYSNFNEFDEKLLRSATEDPVDDVAKAVFLAKKVLDVFNVPSLFEGGLPAKKKEVNAKTYYNSEDVPFRWFEQPVTYATTPSFANKRPPGYRPSSSSSRARGSGARRKHDFVSKYVYS